MKELAGNSSNIALIEIEPGKLQATVEVILLLSEPIYKADGFGFVRSRSLETLRFNTSAKGLSELAKYLGELSEDAVIMEERASLSNALNSADGVAGRLR